VAGNLPGKACDLFLIRSLTPLQAAGNALAIAGSSKKYAWLQKNKK
jgi:hypothetical protein